MIDFTDIHGNAVDIGDAVKCYYNTELESWHMWIPGVVVALDPFVDFSDDGYIDASTIQVDVQGYDMVTVHRNGGSDNWVIEKVA